MAEDRIRINMMEARFVSGRPWFLTERVGRGEREALSGLTQQKREDKSIITLFLA